MHTVCVSKSVYQVNSNICKALFRGGIHINPDLSLFYLNSYGYSKLTKGGLGVHFYYDRPIDKLRSFKDIGSTDIHDLYQVIVKQATIIPLKFGRV